MEAASTEPRPSAAASNAPRGLGTCTRCGLCQQACPTYRDRQLEADSPRGRVFAIERIAAGEPVDAAAATHLYACLGCRACETACPSGVPFGSLLEYGRAEVERAGEVSPDRRGWRLFRRAAFEWVLPSRALFGAMIAPARWIQRSAGVRRLAQVLPMPRMVRRLAAMVPERPSSVRRLPAMPAAGSQRARVGIFVGCVMGALFEHVHAALARVLQRSGCDVVEPVGQWCCGALNVHAGERRNALAMARRNVVAFEQAGVDAIIVDAAGCGAHLKSYGELLSFDPAFAERAHVMASKVVDASEYLEHLDLPPLAACSARRATYQDACHLAHGQGIRNAPRALLRAIPNLDFVEMRDADRCCGAAGVYALTHPDMSERVLHEKLERITQTGADTVVVTNPGCHMQLAPALAASGVRVRHLIELLDEATVPVQSPMPAD